MTLSDKIFAYKDTASREITFCGESVLVVSPTAGAAPALFDAVRNLKGSPEDAKKAIATGLAFDLFKCVPDVAIYCLRDPADPLVPIFEDTPDVRARLQRIPFVESTKLLGACLELLTVKGDNGQ